MSTQRGRKRGPYKPRVPKTAQDAAKAAAIVPVEAAEDISAEAKAISAEYMGELVWHPASIRFVRYRYGWGYMETAPAILCDSLTLAVLLPHDAKPAAACKFQFRAPAGGWSFTHAQEGADPGQYQEV